MIHHERMKYPEHVYPADPWRMVEKRFYPRFLAQTESLFATSNGYLGMRGNFEEGAPAHENGTFVNGFYESWPIIYGEEAYGFAKMGQTIVNVPDGKILKLYVDDEPFYLPTADLREFERSLDMRSGVLNRELLWETPSGKHVSIRSERFASFQHRHLAAISYEVTVLNASAPVVISSEIVAHNPRRDEDDDDPRTAAGFKHRVLQSSKSYTKDLRVMLGYQTKNSGMSLACGMDHVLKTECTYTSRSDNGEESGKVVFSINAESGKPIRLVKFLTYHTSRNSPAGELCERAERTLDRACECGYPTLASDQAEYMDGFWRRSDIQVEGDPAMAQLLRFNLFHILQASARAEGTSIPAKGLTGSGYEGHYFWDTEIYLLPFLIYNTPQVARNLLRFRYSMLDQARERARQMSQKGALFPWRTINGTEASAYYAAGTAQYHINADIMYAMRKYVAVTGDESFVYDYGAEMLVETARLWVDIGFYSERQGGFCIHGVTGPDEYNTVVDNNTYTNLMARENLWYAYVTVEKIREEKPDVYKGLVHRTGLDPDEIAAWKKAADSMYLPYDEELGIHPQDDSFLYKKRWDIENTPPEEFPLLLHHHPLVIYRHQVIKQADVVLAMFLLGNEFSEEQKKRNFEFYDELTTGDSSLSVSIQSIMAFEAGDPEKGREYARYALLMDIADIGGNVKDGMHLASTGGTWMAIVYGLIGMRDHDGEISFNPKMPKRVDRARIPITVRGSLLELMIEPGSVTYTLIEGGALDIRHVDEKILLTPEDSTARRKLIPLSE